MKLLVVAATNFEIEPFISENTIADILITGVGIPQTIYTLSKELFQHKYDLAIQAGIAGTFNKNIQQNSTVIVEKDTYGDIGIQEKNSFTTLFENGFMDKNTFPFRNGWLENYNPFLQKTTLPLVSGITVNMITDDTSDINRMMEKFTPGIETMEGAAFHYVCLKEQVNFLQLRSISNEVGERDKTKWQIKEAITDLNIELKKLVQNFS